MISLVKACTQDGHTYRRRELLLALMESGCKQTSIGSELQFKKITVASDLICLGNLDYHRFDLVSSCRNIRCFLKILSSCHNNRKSHSVRLSSLHETYFTNIGCAGHLDINGLVVSGISYKSIHTTRSTARVKQRLNMNLSLMGT